MKLYFIRGLLAVSHLFAQLAHYVTDWWGMGGRKVQALRERLKTFEEVRQARGVALLREWLSDEQRRNSMCRNPLKSSGARAESAIVLFRASGQTFTN
jgi:hypothetical protein